MRDLTMARAVDGMTSIHETLEWDVDYEFLRFFFALIVNIGRECKGVRAL